MANGSFGLSGLPSAPTVTTVATGAVTPVSAVTTTVSSTAGFSAGDLIYLKNGDYGVPPNATGSTGGVAIYDTQSPVYSGTAGGYMRWPNGVEGGSRGATQAAKLVNGNIVFVFYDAIDTYPYFVINDQNNNTVVGKTLISSTVYSTSQPIIGVVALTGGGFAVYMQDNRAGAERFGYAIYSSGGGTVTAPTRDTSITTSPSLTRIVAVALPNGGFVVALKNSTNSLQTRFFSSTAATGTWATPSGFTATGSADATVSLLARPDNSVVLTCTDGSSSVLFNISSTNTSLGNGRLATGTTSWSYLTSVLLADATVAVLASSGGGGLSFFIVTGTTSASWNTATATGTSSVPYSYITSYLNSLNQMVLWSSGNYGPQYEVFSTTTGASLMGYPRELLCGGQTNNLQYILPAIIETGSNTNLYWTTVGNTSGTGLMSPMTSVSFNTSTYNLNAFASTNGGLLASTSPVSIAAYNKSNSNPNGASYYAAGSGTTSATSSGTTVLVPQTVLESASANTMSSASLPDGGCVVLYKLASGNTIKFVPISKAGVPGGAITVGTGISTDYSARIAVLSDGKICVVYYNSAASASNVLSYKIYSSSYSLLSSGILSVSGTIEAITTNYTRAACLAALPNGNFVVMFPINGGGASFRVYNNTGTALNSDQGAGPGATTDINFAVGGGLDGSVFTSWKGSTTTWQVYWNKNIAGSYSYTATASTSVTGANTSFANRSLPVCQDGGFVHVIQGSSNAQLRKFSASCGDIASNTNAGSTSGGTSYNVGVTGSGIMVAVNAFVAGTPIYWYYTSGVTTTNLSLSAYSGGSNLASITLAGSYGNNVFVSLLNTSAYPTFTLVSNGPFTYPAAYTTSSFTAPITLSPATGFYFTGVATSDCPPGGTGTVVVNGSAQLSSSYPSDTAYQAFDFRTPTLYGAKGTIGGRNVSLQGNT